MSIPVPSRPAPMRGSAPWRDTIRRVVLLGPTHRVAVHGSGAAGRRGLRHAAGPGTGRCRCRGAGCDRCRRWCSAPRAHAQEHSLEVQLPFLQSVLGEFSAGAARRRRRRGGRSGRSARTAVGWGGNPDRDQFRPLPLPALRARRRPSIAPPRDAILALNPQLDHEQACGATPINGLLLCARRHGLAPQLLDLRNSGDTAGDRARVVGYASPSPSMTRAMMSTDLGEALLRIARNAIGSRFELPAAPEPEHEALARPGATFVTLTRNGESARLHRHPGSPSPPRRGRARKCHRRRFPRSRVSRRWGTRNCRARASKCRC